MSCAGETNCTCGCCGGISVMTPQGEANAPGLSAISYRTGTWATFRDSMLARLSSSDYPALAGLKTRSEDDYSIALLDASAVMLDILTFYQERLANESYLRTATQLYSLTQLSRLIGYQPSPGVSASTYLAFTLSSAPGMPVNPNTTAITIPEGTTVQSVPAQGQTPQSFETSAAILAKPDWNALPVQRGVPFVAKDALNSLYLAGTSTQLNPGDAFLLVADNDGGATSNNWYMGIVAAVQPDTVKGRTLISWIDSPGSSGSLNSQTVKFFALRQRATLFGYNAMNPRLLAADTRALLKRKNKIAHGDWIFGIDDTTGSSFASELLIDLDAVYGKMVAPGWVVLAMPVSSGSSTPTWEVAPFYVQSVATASRSDYGMTAKVTRAGVPRPTDSTSAGVITSALEAFYDATRTTSVFAQSEELAIAEQPLDHPLYGTLLDLEEVRQDLIGVAAVAVIGKSQKMTVKAGVASLIFTPDDGTAQIPLNPGDTITLLQPPAQAINADNTIPDWQSYPDTITFSIVDTSGRSGTVKASLAEFTLASAASSDPVTQEVALVASVTVETTPFARTRIALQTALTNCYDRTMTTVNANVGPATGGASVTELLGNGSAATPNQTFKLKQTPLTYTQAPTPSGRTSSLEITVNGAAWKEVQSLYAQPPDAQVFATMNLSGGTTIAQFGDGEEGATLPTGQNNLIASYRVGIGAAGNVAAGSIITLVDRPLGVSGVTNPMPATGGQDAQSVEDIKTNAPQTVLTLGRAVSITDYQNFAATFAGISKAYALWIPNGPYRGVFLTVAGANGAALTGSQTLTNLAKALQAYGNPQIAVTVQSYYETIFRLKAAIGYDPTYDPKAVNSAVMALLNSTYSFASRNFGQGVSGDEVAALLQGVPGVIAVNVTKLKVVATSSAGDLGSAAFSVSTWNNWIAQKQHVKRPHAGHTRICPYVPIATLDSLPQPAEILVLDPDPKAVVLEVMA